MTWRQLLLIGNEEPIADPAWPVVEQATLKISPSASVILYNRDGSHIRADGARLMHTLVFYRDASAPPLLIGRREGKRRGKATLSGDRVVVSTLENWAGDSGDVFRAFFDGAPLESGFTLRDPSKPCTPSEIRHAVARQ